MEERYTLKKPSSMKRRKRVGCGPGSGHGKTCCRGQKGQLSRAGSKKRPWFEGGQMPLQRRVPKRGFTALERQKFQLVNLSSISKLNAQEVNPQVLAENGVIKKPGSPVKILGNGEVAKAVRVYADAFSSSAREKIEKAGGSAVVRKPDERKTATGEQ
jgi:large subunit ribosomal protein L15